VFKSICKNYNDLWEHLKMSDFDPLFQFEAAVAEFWGSKYAVAVDCCTHALELSLRVTPARPWEIAYCPTKTYISVPMMLEKINRPRRYIERKWTEYYHLTDTVIDAAALLEAGWLYPRQADVYIVWPQEAYQYWQRWNDTS